MGLCIIIYVSNIQINFCVCVCYWGSFTKEMWLGVKNKDQKYQIWHLSVLIGW